MSGFWLISYVALWILVVLLTIIVLGLVRQLGVIYQRMSTEDHLLITKEGLDIGVPAPEFRGFDLISQKEIYRSDLLGHHSVLVFVSPSCGPCHKLIPHLTSFQHSRDGKIKVLLFSNSNHEASLSLVNSHNLFLPLIVDTDGSISEVFQVVATPFAYYLDKKGIIQRRGIVNDVEGLEMLIDTNTSSKNIVTLPQLEESNSVRNQ